MRVVCYLNAMHVHDIYLCIIFSTILMKVSVHICGPLPLQVSCGPPYFLQFLHVLGALFLVSARVTLPGHFGNIGTVVGSGY